MTTGSPMRKPLRPGLLLTSVFMEGRMESQRKTEPPGARARQAGRLPCLQERDTGGDGRSPLRAGSAASDVVSAVRTPAGPGGHRDVQPLTDIGPAKPELTAIRNRRRSELAQEPQVLTLLRPHRWRLAGLGWAALGPIFVKQRGALSLFGFATSAFFSFSPLGVGSWRPEEKASAPPTEPAGRGRPC